MHPLTRDFPKPLLPVADRPVLDYLIEGMVGLDSLEQIHIVSNDRFHTHFQVWLNQHLGQGTFGQVGVHLHNDGTRENEHRLGASGCLQLVLEQVGEPSRLLVSAGDNIYRFSLAPLWRKFLQDDRHYIVALPEGNEERLKRTGVLEFGSGNRVRRLHEKPEHPPSHWSCPPLYFLQPPAWRELEQFLGTSGNHDAPGHFIDFLCQRQVVQAFKLQSGRLDIGSIASYHDADRLLREGQELRENGQGE
jgi:glucose-1-phosphate thymidylyltransferase